ncbi:MAG: DUF4199 domain-containing protein [Bacteroidota bacterium]
MHKETIKLGVIYGIFSIVLTTITAYISPKSIMSLTHWSTIIAWIALIGFGYLGAKKARERKGGFIPFGEALVPSFLTIAIGSLISSLFMYILVNFINPDLIAIMQEAALEMSDGMIDLMGGTEEMKLQAREKAEQDQAGVNPFGLGTILLNYVVSLVFPLLPIAAIIAAIVKKNEPMPVV